MAGYIARVLGGTRFIDSTSGADEVRWMRDELGYGSAVTRDSGSVRSQLALAAVSSEPNPASATLKAAIEAVTFQLILRDEEMRGFSADEQDPEPFDGWIDQVLAWRMQGGIRFSYTMFQEWGAVSLVLEQACTGQIKGVVLVVFLELQ